MAAETMRTLLPVAKAATTGRQTTNRPVTDPSTTTGSSRVITTDSRVTKTATDLPATTTVTKAVTLIITEITVTTTVTTITGITETDKNLKAIMTSKRIMTDLSSKLNRATNRKISPKLKGFIVVLFISLCFSCDRQALYDQYQAIDNTMWGKDKEYYFSFHVDDISVPYNLTFEVRNNNMYPYQNLWLFCNEEQPIGPLKRDTIECVLADEFGKWHGHGISLFQSSFPIRTNYKFEHPGMYTFSFRQGMRDSTLRGIQEIGFRVEKTN